MSQIPSPITASIGKKILQNAPLLFNNNLNTIISEMVQNSRRAGATKIDFEVIQTGANKARISITDNGTGISHENFKTLLEFGTSDWEDKTEYSETPAGMGFFSLAKRNPTIESHGLQTTLKDTVFTGQSEAPVMPGHFTEGTRITFDLTPADLNSVHENLPGGGSWYPQPLYKAAIIKETFYSNMEVTLNGEKMPRKKFGESAIKSVSCYGVIIHIFSSSEDRNGNTHYPRESGTVSFFGHIIKEPAFTKNVCDNADTRGKDSVKPNQLEPLRFFSKKSSYTYAVEIENTSHLSPKLPDRNELHKNDAISEIAARALREIYLIIAENKTNKISTQHYQEAIAMGIKMPAPIKTLTRKNSAYSEDEVYYHEKTELPEDAIFISEKCTTSRETDKSILLQNIILEEKTKRNQKNLCYYVVPKTITTIKNTITEAVLLITDSYGVQHKSHPLENFDFNDKTYTFIKNIKEKSGAMTREIEVILKSAEQKTVLKTNILYLITSQKDEYYNPEDDIILFSPKLENPQTAFEVIKRDTYDYDLYDNTPYGSWDEQSAEEGEENYDTLLNDYIINEIMNRSMYKDLFKESLMRAIQENIQNMNPNIRDSVENFTITGKKNGPALFFEIHIDVKEKETGNTSDKKDEE